MAMPRLRRTWAELNILLDHNRSRSSQPREYRRGPKPAVTVQGEEETNRFKFVAATKQEAASHEHVAVGGGAGESDWHEADGKEG